MKYNGNDICLRISQNPTIYNILFTILDAHVTNTSPIHHQTLIMMYKYVKNNSNINIVATHSVN